MLILIPLAIAAGLAIWLKWLNSAKTIYTGIATVEWLDVSVTTKDRYWTFFRVPGVKDSIMVPITKERHSMALFQALCPIVVKKRPLSSPWIEQVTWPDGKVETPEQESFTGIVPGLLFLALGLATLYAAAKLGLGRAWYLEGALAIAAAGFAGNFSRLREKELRNAPMRLLNFINVGTGVSGQAIAALILGAVTVACYWTPGFWMLFPGINASFELGGIVSLLVISFSHHGSNTSATGSTSA